MKSYKLILFITFVAMFVTAIASDKTANAANYCNPGSPLSPCLLSGGVTPPTTAPAPGEAYTGMSSGTFEYSKTDLTIAAPIPIEVTRTYREFDTNANGPIYGAFGIGTTLNYDIYLYSSTEVTGGSYYSASVVLPDGGQILCTNIDPTCNQSGGSSCPFYGQITGQHPITTFQCDTQPIGKWFNSQIIWDPTVPGGGGWDLTRKDGTVYAFGAGAPLQSIKDRYNNSITLTRAAGQLGGVTTITASNGRQLTLNYTNGCITSYTDPAQRAINYTYSSQNQLTQVAYPKITGTTPNIKYTWSSTHPQDLNTIATNLDSSHTDYINIGYTNAAAQVTSIYPGTSGNTSLGVQYVYDTGSGGNITDVKATFPDGSKRKLFFNANGYVTEDIKDFNGNNQETYTYSRDSANRVTDVLDLLGRDTHYEYDQDGNVTAVTQSYDDYQTNLVISVTISYQYDYTKYDQLKQVTNGIGNIWTIINDASGNPLSVTDPLQRTWSASYNSNGLITSVTDPAAATNSPPNTGALFTYVYNSTSDLQSVADRASETTSFQYDAVGRQTQVTSPLQESQSAIYDDKDEILSVTDPNRDITTYAYNWNGNITSLTDANGYESTWRYTPPATTSWWNVKECDPNGKCNAYVLNYMSGQVSEYTDKRGVQNVYTYDDLGHMTEAHFDTTSVLPDNRTIKYVYDLGNRVTDITDSKGGATPCRGSQSGDNESFSYDWLDDVLTACTPEGTVVYTFDTIGQRMSMAPAGQPTVSYMWDRANEITSVSATGTSANITYTSDAQRQTLTVNNVTSSYAYDPASERVSSISYASTQNPSLGSLSYQYDTDGRITGKSGNVATVQLPAIEGPGLGGNDPITYDVVNQIELWNGVSTSVDKNDNLVADPASISGATYTWDGRNSLSTVTAGGKTTYKYDALGRRESVVSGGATIPYMYDGASPVSVGSVNIVSLPGSNEILTLSGVVPIHDALGSTLATVNSAGALATQYTYDPFGNVTPPSAGYGTTFGMGGIELDPTGLYHAGARYYHPTLQRFLSADPAGFGGGDANLFAYSGNDPVNASDPSGLDATGCNGDCTYENNSNEGISVPIFSPGFWEWVASLFSGASHPAPVFNQFHNELKFARSFQTVGAEGGYNAFAQFDKNVVVVDQVNQIDVIGGSDGNIIRVQALEPLELEPEIGEDALPESASPESEGESGDPGEADEPENEHSKNKRPSTQEKHERGQRRKKIDRPGGEKGDERRPYRQRGGIWWWINGWENQV